MGREQEAVVSRRSAGMTTLVVGLVLAGLLSGCRSSTGSPTGAASPAASPATATEPTSQPELTPTIGSTPTTAAVSPTPTTGVQQTDVSVYFLRGEHLAATHRAIPRTPQVGTAALAELLAGPTAEEQSIGFSSAIPPGTRLLGLTIENGVATVDLSGQFAEEGGSLSMTARVAQVVFTLTQFPSVQGVQFRLDGQPVDALGGEGLMLDRPVGRADFEELLPAIFVESPAPFAVVSGSLHLRGTANTFEATFMIRLTDASGAVLLEQPVMASSGSGTRGSFDVTLDLAVQRAGPGTLTVYEVSARDGSPVNVVDIPVMLER